MNIHEIKSSFTDYVSGYDMTDPMILRKYNHTFQVAARCREIAISLNLSKEEIEVAEIIGMLHDLGRFDQAKFYKTYVDELSFDHAAYAVKLLSKSEIQKQFQINEKWKNIILKAIQYHSMYKLPSDLTEQENLFCKIIRDADKIDILRIYNENNWQKDQIINLKINTKAFDTFMSGHCVLNDMVKTQIDKSIIGAAFIYDINFPFSKELIKQLGYYDSLFKINFTDPETQKQMEQIKIRLYKELDSGKIR